MTFLKHALPLLAMSALMASCDLPSALWSKPGVSRQQYESDSADCEEDVQNTNFGIGPVTGPNKKAFYEKCMTDLGYTKEGEKSGGHLHNPPGILEPSER